jgi:hypothetical protein
MSTRMYCGGHGEWLPCATCARNLAKRYAPPADDRSALERRQDEIDEDRMTEAAEWEARDRFIEGYDA